jgi:hypothetical protein
MDKYTQGRLDSQVRRVRQCRRQMLEDQDLCFTKLLPKEQVEAALERQQVHFRAKKGHCYRTSSWTLRLKANNSSLLTSTLYARFP